MAMLKNRVLVVDDEQPIRNVLERILKQEGYGAILAASGKEGLLKVRSEKPDLVVLDLNLPDVNGEEVCQRIRKDPSVQSVPILILTGCTTEGLTGKCLNGGADDFMDKPFEITELVARVRALLRRPRLYRTDDSVIRSGQIAIYRAERLVTLGSRQVRDFAPKEFDLLTQLILHAPKVLDKETLALKVWGTPATQLNRRTLDVHIRRIRQKLGSGAANYLRTVPAIGYQWLDKI